MVRTGKRAATLATLLNQAGLVADGNVRPAPRIDDLGSDLGGDILDLYRRLGGRIDRPELRPGPWDLAMGGLLIELDEELHFNRYREMTLARPWADALPWSLSYRDACATREPDCLRAAQWGQRWTSSGSEGMFGQAAAPGDLAAPSGAPRWKQRALYDAMKDASVLEGDFKLARLSVYDEVSEELLGDVLRGRATLEIDDLMTLLTSRTV